MRKYPNSLEVVQESSGKIKPLDDFWYAAKMSNERFVEAARKAITQSGLFREVIQNGNAEFRLELLISKAIPPQSGGDMVGNIEVYWRLTDLRNNQVMFQEFIASKHLQKLSDTLVGTKRARLAMEGAARANIEKGIGLISELAP